MTPRRENHNLAHGRRLLGCARNPAHPTLDNSGLPQKFHPAVAKKFRARSGTNPALSASVDHPVRIAHHHNQGEQQNHVQDQRNNQRGQHLSPLSARCRALAGGPPEHRQTGCDEDQLDHETPVRTYLHARSPSGRAWHFGFAPATQALVEVVRLCGGVPSWEQDRISGERRQTCGGANLSPKKSALWTGEFPSAISPRSRRPARLFSSWSNASPAIAARRSAISPDVAVCLALRSTSCSPISSRGSNERRAA